MILENKDWATQLVQKSDEILDKFESDTGLPTNILPGSKEEFQSYLSMDTTHLDKLDYKECANISYRLIQFSIYVQRCLNREKAKSKILVKKINTMIASRIDEYRGSWDIQRCAAIADNTAATALSSELTESEARQERLEFVASGFKNLADQMKTIQFSKRDNNG